MAITGWTKTHAKGVCNIELQIQGDPVISLDNYTNLLEDLIKEAGNPHTGALLLYGPPGKFFFGMNVAEIGALTTISATRGVTSMVQDLLNDLENSPTALVCAIDGTCFGGGLELILAFHIVMATPSAAFGLPEIKLGTIPSFGGTQRLPRVLGRNRALKVMLTGESFSAEEALDWGLVSELLPAEDFILPARKMAERLAGLSRPALAALLQSTIRGYAIPLQYGLGIESMASSRLAGGADLVEGINAFKEKRRPRFLSTIEDL
ncbi:MAG: enoyl-CoA hydratase [Desulfobacteraceae bacterium]|jgi:enoyl-CoA hydratase/carnithine racemase|nr:MAG: enoyl-CoA hydratase [Desulfobacteraceae bacterium]